MNTEQSYASASGGATPILQAVESPTLAHVLTTLQNVYLLSQNPVLQASHNHAYRRSIQAVTDEIDAALSRLDPQILEAITTNV